jgi:SpoVK/Ycf46/Vps4 family AAA+-type ATPase
VKPQRADTPCFYVICINELRPETQTVTVERSAPVTLEELALNYGPDFPAWEIEWITRMSRHPSGLTILFGPPGCGKTSYLRALMTRLLGKAVFYFVPVSEVEMLSNPRFVSFWMKETKRHQKKQKIAILEDAEELLLPRDGGSRDRVSNLLNIADGFLGDHLKLHVLATTNVPIGRLDPAIMRPGRLVGVREFRRLSREEALRVAEAKGLNLPDQPDFSLAELYCAHADIALFGRQRIGFA